MSRHNLLYRHDRVAKNVIINRYDAGAVKESVYEKYSRFLKPLARSDEFQDFVVVCRNGFPREKKRRLEDALLTLWDADLLRAFKTGAVGCVPATKGPFANLGPIIERVNAKFGR